MRALHRDPGGPARIARGLPFRVGFWGGLLSELIGRAIRLKRPPHITRYAVGLIARPTLFSTAKARTRLGWRPTVSIEEGLKRTLDWHRQHTDAAGLAVAAAADR